MVMAAAKPVRAGPIMPPTLASELMSAIPVAAEGPCTGDMQLLMLVRLGKHSNDAALALLQQVHGPLRTCRKVAGSEQIMPAGPQSTVAISREANAAEGSRSMNTAMQHSAPAAMRKGTTQCRRRSPAEQRHCNALFPSGWWSCKHRWGWVLRSMLKRTCQLTPLRLRASEPRLSGQRYSNQ